jgi:hypothetical protein
MKINKTFIIIIIVNNLMYFRVTTMENKEKAYTY